MSKIIEIAKKRREYVNENFKRIVEGTHMSNKNKSKLLKKLWKEAKRKFSLRK